MFDTKCHAIKSGDKQRCNNPKKGGMCCGIASHNIDSFPTPPLDRIKTIAMEENICLGIYSESEIPTLNDLARKKQAIKHTELL